MDWVANPLLKELRNKQKAKEESEPVQPALSKSLAEKKYEIDKI